MSRYPSGLADPGQFPTSTPSESLLFARAITGDPSRGSVTNDSGAGIDCEYLVWLAAISPEHARRLRNLPKKPRGDEPRREQLEWLADISPEHARQLRDLQREEAVASEARERSRRIIERLELERAAEAEWDDSKHPRAGGPPNAGWFVSTGGSDGIAPRPANPSPKPDGLAHPPRQQDQLAQAKQPAAGANQRRRGAINVLPKKPTPEEKEHQILAAAERKLKFAPNVKPEARQRVLDTLKTMYNMGEGTIARALVVAITRQTTRINIKLKPSTPPAARKGERILGQPEESSTIFLDPDDPMFGADWAMEKFPAEKPAHGDPDDKRGAVVVLAHELGHVLDDLRLTDAKYLDGRAPYAKGNDPVRGANVLLENAVRKEVAASKISGLNRGGMSDLRQRTAYAGIPYNAKTPIAGEEFERLNKFLEPLGKALPDSIANVIPEGQYRDN